MASPTAPSIPSLAEAIDALASARAGLSNPTYPSIPSLSEAIDALASARAGLYDTAHPSVPSLADAIEALASARAGLWNATRGNNASLANATKAAASAKATLVNRAPVAAMASVSSSNFSVNSTTFVTVDPDNFGLVVASYIILGVFLGLFLYLIGLDMVRKSRTGELRDDMEGTKNLVVTVGKGVPRLIFKAIRKIKNAKVFQKKKKQQHVESAEDTEGRKKNATQTKAIIDRLAGKESRGVGAVESLARVISKSVLDPLRESSDASGSMTNGGLFEDGSEFIVCDSSGSSIV